MFLFSYPFTESGERHQVVYCPVDPHTSIVVFCHRMQRYMYDAETSKFVPGTLNLGRTFGDLLDQFRGLKTDEVLR
jgi:hypothetical protein